MPIIWGWLGHTQIERPECKVSLHVPGISWGHTCCFCPCSCHMVPLQCYNTVWSHHKLWVPDLELHIATNRLTPGAILTLHYKWMVFILLQFTEINIESWRNSFESSDLHNLFFFFFLVFCFQRQRLIMPLGLTWNQCSFGFLGAGWQACSIMLISLSLLRRADVLSSFLKGSIFT